MPTAVIEDLDDPRLAPFRDIRTRSWIDQSGHFIAEGPLLVEQLLASSYPTRSILLDQKFEAHYSHFAEFGTDMLLVKHELVAKIVGFHFHRGVIGCGVRKPRRDVRELEIGADQTAPMVATAGVQDPENVGGIMRNCAAFGVRHVIVGPGSSDPLSRRALRVSMGNVLRLNLFHSENLLEDLHWLREERGVRSLAACLSADAISLERVRQRGPTILVFGNERYGLPDDLQAGADHRIRIDMQPGTDSLNVCVAAGIMLHHFSRRQPDGPSCSPIHDGTGARLHGH